MKYLDAKLRSQLGPKQGLIPLFSKGAIGLQPRRDVIQLHRRPEGVPYQKLLGLFFYLTAEGEGPKDWNINRILKATEFRVKIPGSVLPYYAKMNGWEIYLEYSPGNVLYKPTLLTLSGEEGENTHFAFLDQHSTDPCFPFWQFGRLLEVNKPTSLKHRWNLYRLGVNIPVMDSMVPGWADKIPSEIELLDMLKPGLWNDIYEVETDFAPCDVEDGYESNNYAATMVRLGGAKYDDGQVTYVGGWYVGDNTKPWPEGIWEGTVLTMLSGNAQGKRYLVVKNHVTNNNPPLGMPPNERLLEVDHKPGHMPVTDGVQVGDYYKVQSYFGYNIKQYVFDKFYFEPGHHAAQTLKYTFMMDYY